MNYSQPRQLHATEKRDQVLGVVRLLGAPEDIVDLQVLCRELDQFGNRYALSGFRIHILVVAILDRNANGNDPAASLIKG